MAVEETNASRPADARAILAGHRLFASLTPAERDRLVGKLRRRRCSPNEVIFRKGDAGSSMMAVTRGQVKISTYSGDGRGVVLNIIDTGEIFGEIALLDGKERTADAHALGETDLLVLERRDFLPLLERHPALARRLLEILCHRLRRTSEQVEDQLFLVRPVRLAKTLLRLADEFGTETEDGIAIGVKLSQGELGNLTGLTRESINKQLSEWRRKGLIRFHRGTLTLLDRTPLDRLVQDAI